MYVKVHKVNLLHVYFMLLWLYMFDLQETPLDSVYTL